MIGFHIFFKAFVRWHDPFFDFRHEAASCSLTEIISRSIPFVWAFQNGEMGILTLSLTLCKDKIPLWEKDSLARVLKGREQQEPTDTQARPCWSHSSGFQCLHWPS